MTRFAGNRMKQEEIIRIQLHEKKEDSRPTHPQEEAFLQEHRLHEEHTDSYEEDWEEDEEELEEEEELLIEQSRPKKKREKRKKKKSFIARIGSLIQAIPILVLLIGGLSFGVVTYYMNRAQGEPLDPTALSISEEAKSIYGPMQCKQILCYGLDTREDELEGRSDAIMLVTLDYRHGKVKLTSVARDTYVYLTDRGNDKINHAYAYGGPQLAVSTFNGAFHTNVEDYAVTNFWSLAKIIDYVGGVEVDVDSDELYYVNALYTQLMNEHYMEAEDPIQETGLVHLNGGQAVAYARIRYVGNDVARGGRQREVLMALFEKVKQMPVWRLPGFVDMAAQQCGTSLTSPEVTAMGGWLLLNKNRLEIETLSLPDEELDNGGQTIDGIWYYTYDVERASQKIRDFILETEE